ncbi:MAG: RNA polymerase sigma factor [Bacteroidota bacterium]
MNQAAFSYKRMQDAVVNGRRQELLRLYQPCFEDLMLYCLGKCRNMEMAEDAAAETLKALLEHPDPKRIPNLKAWLLSVAHNISIKMLDKKVRRKRILDNLSPNLPKSEEMDISEQLDMEGLEKKIRSFLPERDFLIWSWEQQGFKDQEIAEKLDMNPKTVANRKSLIKKEIRQKFGGYTT